MLYHANKISRGDLTSWYGDIVAEGEHATLSMVYPRLYLTRLGARQAAPSGRQTDVMTVTDPQDGRRPRWPSSWTPSRTAARGDVGEDNLKSVAMVLAAIDSAHHGERASPTTLI